MLVVEPRDPSDIRADGGSRQHDGSLRSHRTAESDGRGAADDRGPAVVARDARIAARHGVEHARDALRNIVPDDVFDEQRRQNDADGGVDQEQDVGAVHRKPVGQSVFDAVQQHLEQIGAHSGEHADDHGQKHHDLAVAQPPREAEERAVDVVGA